MLILKDLGIAVLFYIMRFYIRLTLLVFFVVLLVTLFSCDNGEVDSLGGPLFETEVDTKNHYFFYLSESTLYAVDPESPGYPVRVADNVIAPALLQHQLSLANDPNTKFTIYPALVYTSGGRIWGINTLKGNLLRKRQLSNEQNAFRICRIHGRYGESIFDLGYEYTTPGENGICDNEFASDNDDVSKAVTLDMDSSSNPIPMEYVISKTFNNSVAIFFEWLPESGYYGKIGELVREGNELVWYDGDLNPQSRLVIESGLNNMLLMSYSSGNTVLLNLDNQLKLFSPYSKSLSQTLFVFQTGSYPRVVPDRSDLNYITIIDPTGVYRMFVGGEYPVEPLYTPESPVTYIEHINTTENSIYFRVRKESELVYYSISKDGVHLIEWHRQSFNYANMMYRLSDLTYAFYEANTKSVSFVTTDGKPQRTLNNSFIVSDIRYTKSDSNRPWNNYIEMLLIGTVVTSGEISLSTHNINGNLVATLGKLNSSNSNEFWRRPVVSNNKMLITLPGNNSEEVFFASLDTNNSLTQITQNKIEEYINWPIYIEF